MRRTIARMALLGMLTGTACAGGPRLRAAPAAPAAAPVPSVPAEPAAPTASPAVQKALDEAAQLAKERKSEEALAAAERALDTARQARDVAGEAYSARARAFLLQVLGRDSPAVAAWREAATAWARMGDGPGQVEASVAQALLVAGDNAEAAQQQVEEAIRVARAETRRPVAVARALYSAAEQADDLRLSSLAWKLAEAGQHLSEQHAPGSRALAMGLYQLGYLASGRSDLAAAQDYYQRAVTIFETQTPGSLALAMILTNLGNVARSRGNLTTARDCHQRALNIFEKLAPGSPTVATSLHNLGIVAADQGDLAAARDYYERARMIAEKQAPDPHQQDQASRAVPSILNELGTIAYSQGDLTAARDHFQRAMVIWEKQAPGSLDVATSLNNLGNVAADQGDLTAARDYYERARVIADKQAPGSLVLAHSLNNLGTVAYSQRDLTSARDYFQRALAIKDKQAPGSLDVAATLNNLGETAYKHGERQRALEVATQAWQIVRNQSASVSGDDARQAFGSEYADYAAQLARYQLALRQTGPAFATLEEGRAQGLQQLLLERGITARLAPSEQWKAYQEAVATHNRALKALEQMLKAQQDQGVPSEQADVEVAARRAEEVRTRVDAERCWSAVKQALPAVMPESLPPEAACRSLPARTLFLAFSVGEEDTTLFVARRQGSVAAYYLHLTRKELTALVDRMRRSAAGEAEETWLRVRAKAAPRGVALAGVPPRGATERDTFRKLFPREVRKALEGAERLVISPDDVLWKLPFAALVTNARGAPRYLGLEKPLTYAQSLTLFVQALRAPPARPGGTLSALVVGNPLYDNRRRAEMLARSMRTAKQTQRKPAVKVASARREATGELRTLTRDGDIPDQLPHAETEAQDVAHLYSTAAHIGVEPTESWFREGAGKVDVIHLATHGLFNRFQAMSSGVLLAIPEKTLQMGETDNDGALQAWELMSQEALRLKAELVVLSACETGRGATVTSEGLVGLTRALQVAGARSIVASQWPVADRSTATLMVAFHKHLRTGMAKDEALRQAMRVVAGKAATAHPYYWAPFLLVGDPENRILKRTGAPPARSVPAPAGRTRVRILAK